MYPFLRLSIYFAAYLVVGKLIDILRVPHQHEQDTNEVDDALAKHSAFRATKIRSVGTQRL